MASVASYPREDACFILSEATFLDEEAVACFILVTSESITFGLEYWNRTSTSNR